MDILNRKMLEGNDLLLNSVAFNAATEHLLNVTYFLLCVRKINGYSTDTIKITHCVNNVNDSSSIYSVTGRLFTSYEKANKHKDYNFDDWLYGKITGKSVVNIEKVKKESYFVANLLYDKKAKEIDKVSIAMNSFKPLNMFNLSLNNVSSELYKSTINKIGILTNAINTAISTKFIAKMFKRNDKYVNMNDMFINVNYISSGSVDYLNKNINPEVNRLYSFDKIEGDVLVLSYSDKPINSYDVLHIYNNSISTFAILVNMENKVIPIGFDK